MTLVKMEHVQMDFGHCLNINNIKSKPLFYEKVSSNCNGISVFEHRILFDTMYMSSSCKFTILYVLSYTCFLYQFNKQSIFIYCNLCCPFSQNFAMAIPELSLVVVCLQISVHLTCHRWTTKVKLTVQMGVSN